MGEVRGRRARAEKQGGGQEIWEARAANLKIVGRLSLRYQEASKCRRGRELRREKPES